MPFPLTLTYAKMRLQIPAEAADQDALLLASIEVARAALGRFVGQTVVVAPPDNAYIRMRESAMMIVTDIVQNEGKNVFGPHVATPAWQGMVSDLGNAAKLRVREGEEEEDEGFYESLKDTLRASGGLTITPDDDDRRLAFTPTWAATFKRRAGYSATRVITAAYVHLSGVESQSHLVTMPAMSESSAYVWVWFARPGYALRDVVVADVGSAYLAFGAGTALSVENMLGTVFVTQEKQLPPQWSNRVVSFK